MISRVSIGLIGLVVLLLAFTWPQILSVPTDSFLNAASGPFTAVIIMLGVYLLFYALTGDWLPSLRRSKDKG